MKPTASGLRNRQVPILVLMGGASAERPVSLRSGEAVARALDALGHPVQRLDVLSPDLGGFPSKFGGIVFLALHGRWGEDGTVQRSLEARHIPYTGSGPEGSRLAMDKWATKERFERLGIPTARWLRIPQEATVDGVREAVEAAFGWPAVVKPRAEGSSVGVAIVERPDALAAALATARRIEPDTMVERFVPGREMTVGILGERALPVIELRPMRRFFDYTAKYEDAGTEYVVDPPLADPDREAIQSVALAAHRCLGCEGFSRVDLIWSEAEGPRVLEVNSIPGLTERSLLPKAARAAGIEFPALCERMLELGVARGTAQDRGVA